MDQHRTIPAFGHSLWQPDSFSMRAVLRTSMVYILLLLFLCPFWPHSPLASAYVTRIEQCEPITIPRCQPMPYNMTQMPNLVHHNTQQNAGLIFQRYEELIDRGCSDVLLFLLCAIYVPICPVSLLQREPIPPCRDVCERAKQGCEPVLSQYNVSWTHAFLDCSRLPWYERGVCVIPEAIVQKSKPDVPKRSVEEGIAIVPSKRKDPFPVCRCKRKRPSWRWFRKYRYDFAIRAVLKKRKRNRRGELLYKVKVTQVLFSGQIHLKRSNIVTLVLVPSQCACVKLRKGRHYLILGHENRETQRLIVSKLSVIARWREVFPRRIAKWNNRLDRRRRQNKRYRTDATLSSRFPKSDKTSRPDTGAGSDEATDHGAEKTGPNTGANANANSQERSSSLYPEADAGEDLSQQREPASSLDRERVGHRGLTDTAALSLDGLQNGSRHGGRYYSAELEQLRSS